MIDQYSRTARLIGRENVEKLHTKRVAVFGLGGVGSGAIEALARSGIGALDIIDDDKVALTNLNRQILYTRKDYGKPKAEAATEYIHSIDPRIKVTPYRCFYLPEKKNLFDFSSWDYVVDCIDTVTAKIDIICEAKKTGVPILSAMGCGNKLDPTKLVIGELFKTSGDPLAKVMRHELRKRGVTSLTVVYSTETPIAPDLKDEQEDLYIPPQSENGKNRKTGPGSSPFVPPAAGLLLAYKVVSDLLAIKN